MRTLVWRVSDMVAAFRAIGRHDIAAPRVGWKVSSRFRDIAARRGLACYDLAHISNNIARALLPVEYLQNPGDIACQAKS